MQYFEGRLLTQNGRFPTMMKAMELCESRGVKTIVETGTARCGDTNFDGDGGFTIIFGHWAYANNIDMFSVDISESHIDIAQKASVPFHRNLHFILQDSVEFLRTFQGKIDFLYLDSYDYNENHPGPPQAHCLKEIKAAYDKLHEASVVMIDDCNIPGGGKGKLAIEWLLARGWKKVTNRHQVILVKTL
jgi:hypothetical protein